jgi:hypothetical protein
MGGVPPGSLGLCKRPFHHAKSFLYCPLCPILLNSVKSHPTLESDLQGSPAPGQLSALAGDSRNSARLACPAAAIKTTTRSLLSCLQLPFHWRLLMLLSAIESKELKIRYRNKVVGGEANSHSIEV